MPLSLLFPPISLFKLIFTEMCPYSLKLYVSLLMVPLPVPCPVKVGGACGLLASVHNVENSWKISSWLWFPGAKHPYKYRGLFLDRKFGKFCGLRRHSSSKKLENICWGPGRGRERGGHRTAFQEGPVPDRPDSRWLSGDAGGEPLKAL